MARIVQKDDNVLREVAVDVVPEEIQDRKVQQIIKSMQKALKEQPDGVAIAAPQIGKSLRIFIVSERVFDDRDIDMVFINPEIIKHSKDVEHMHEGCLSVRGWYGTVNRYVRATVRALDEHGKSVTLDGKDLLAQIFQHEIDHLDGVLFIDKAIEVHETTEEEGALNHRERS